MTGVEAIFRWHYRTPDRRVVSAVADNETEAYELIGIKGASFLNRTLESLPVVGMGATLKVGTDRYAYTVVEVKERRGTVRVRVQSDRSERTDEGGMTECQTYRHHRDEGGDYIEAIRRKNGTWKIVSGRGEVGYTLFVGERDAYHDYSF